MPTPRPRHAAASEAETTTATAPQAPPPPAAVPVFARPRFVLASEIAGYCAVDLKTVHNWTEEGRLRCHRTPGGHRRYRAADVAAFLTGGGWPIPLSLAALVSVEARREAEAKAKDVAAAEAILAEDAEELTRARTAAGVAIVGDGLGDGVGRGP